MILKIMGCRLVYHYHNKGISERQDNWLLNRLYKYQLKNSRVILLSPSLYYDLKKYVNPEQVYFCANGIPSVETSPDLLFSKSGKPVPEMLFLSNMMKEKGVFVLLEACSILKEKGQSFKTLMVGAWSDIREDDFVSYVSEKGLESYIEYTGAIYGHEKYKIYSRADFFVHPSLNDCFPLVTLEAMQFGLPVISTNDGGIPDIIEDNYNGFIVTKGNPQELADKILILLNDYSLRIEMGKRSYRKFHDNFTIGHFEKRFLSILTKIESEFSQQ